jgi:transcriptional regulator with XRE-family HTH domain
MQAPAPYSGYDWPVMPQDPVDEAHAYSLALGLVVQRLRERRKWNQIDLARRIGTSQSTLSRVEAGTIRCGPLTFQRLAASFDLSGDQLHAQIEASLRKAEQAVQVISPNSEESSWLAAGVGIAGMFGLIGLIGYAVAAVLSDDDEPSKPASRPTKTTKPSTK